MYFVCSEGLANVAKHSRATSGAITVAVQDGRFVVWRSSMTAWVAPMSALELASTA